MSPFGGQPLSVAPLTLSHAQVISVVRGCLDRLSIVERSCGEDGAENSRELNRGNHVDNTQLFS
jgi:hypothetical protein